MTDKPEPKDDKTAPDAPGRWDRIRTHLGYAPVMLGLFALSAAAALAFGDATTHDAIAERHAEDLKASLVQVVPEDLHDNDLLADVMSLDGKTVYRALKDGHITALAYESVGYGYGGEIVVLMSVDAEGVMLGARVLKHAETPGLGDKIEEAKSPWILQFAGLGFGNPPREAWAVKKDGGRFDQFSGATITPRAVVGAIRSGLDFFHAHQGDLLGAGS